MGLEQALWLVNHDTAAGVELQHACKYWLYHLELHSGVSHSAVQQSHHACLSFIQEPDSITASLQHESMPVCDQAALACLYRCHGQQTHLVLLLR